jgi:SRSO17 transposase
MPAIIVPAPCPPPSCNLAPRDVEAFVDALAAYHALFADAFRRPEQDQWSRVYLRGLLDTLPRKTVERIALTQGVNVRDLQHFIGQSAWAIAPVVAQHQRLVADTLADPDGVVLIDESGVVKQGHDSVGVAPQYCGAVGKVANCQVGVYLGYASPKGYTLLASRLYLPEAWCAPTAADRRKRAGIPASVTFQTKPELALTLLRETLERAGLPCTWVAVDALYGDTPTFLDGVAALKKWYFAEVACSTQVWWRVPEVWVPPAARRGRRPAKARLRYPYQRARRVDAIARRIPRRMWQRVCIKDGSKGPILADIACLRVWNVRQGLPGQEVWLVVRRDVDNPSSVKFYLSNAPASCAHARLARMCGARWPVELCFAEGKGEVGLDHYETRSWQGWHHHMTLVALAHHFLVRLRVQLHEVADALTVEQVRLLLSSVLPKPRFDAAAALRMVVYYQWRNHGAKVSHWRTRMRRRLATAPSG